jgi:5-methylcytosine-specific restriction endonuclease McrA
MSTCNKCTVEDWGIWTSSTTGKEYRYCRNCRRQRAVIYTNRKIENGGSHTKKEWKLLLARSPHCAICLKPWNQIPPRPDRRYKYVWTEDHIIPLSLGGNDSIENIQAVCYKCNSSKCNRI